MPPVLHDSVTLRHFASCNLLSLLQAVQSNYPQPYWTEAIREEVERTARTAIGKERTECRYILSQSWLGTPVAPAAADQLRIQGLWIALNSGVSPPVEHAGEAESIYFAAQLGAFFATDDNAAYDFAARRLGAAQVMDTIDILRAAVAAGQIRGAGAAAAVAAIRGAGRFLRRVHPGRITDSYFPI